MKMILVWKWEEKFFFCLCIGEKREFLKVAIYTQDYKSYRKKSIENSIKLPIKSLKIKFSTDISRQWENNTFSCIRPWIVCDFLSVSNQNANSISYRKPPTMQKKLSKNSNQPKDTKFHGKKVIFSYRDNKSN